MSKPKTEKPERDTAAEIHLITTTAVTVFKVDEYLSVAVELEIVDGVVTKATQLSRAENLDRNALGDCSARLWQLIKTNQPFPRQPRKPK